ncbi:unnamed protein product [Kluyveromyces dobzhanskii CBS 2104]|uniref:WGS project CCBQ000000000 data, contig 00010 n=1 Tax=Kluyveromyces dobzhanskii CBS 2104 TaxID=1427455 RepID=A0A0A8LAW9_9SACH|nr:unnamed protein product [Kluyveromyces dobzhanskii CBS 2104]
MKFGTQILDKSVPEWKLHNIDYQQLKTGIRRCTTVRADQEAQFAPSTVEEDPELRSLRRLFRSQFEMVNVFVSMKLKECSTRIVSIENYLTQVHLIKDEKKKLRRVKLINQHLDRCNLELQKLSRYLILQKIAVRKLFKKFLKHYPYGEAVAQEFVSSLKGCPEFKEGHEGVSMLTVDLDPYLLEISLIVDLLHEMELDPAEVADGVHAHAQGNNNGNNNFSPAVTNSSSRKSSTASAGYIVDTTLNYDHYFLSKFNPLGSFLVSQESEDEIKFLLIKLGFCLFDDSVMATSKKILNGDSLLVKRKASVKSLRLFRDAQRDDVGSSALQPGEAEERPVLDSQEDEAGSKHSHHRAYSSSSAHNILFEPLVKPGTDVTNLYNSTEENFFPNLLVSYPNSNDSILLCHVGGLRNHISTDSIQYSDIKSVLKGSEPSLTPVSNRLDEFCRDWCYSHNFKFTDFSIKSRRSRFVISHSTVETSNDYLICLDDNIEVNDQKLPFAILEVKTLETKAPSAQKKSYSKKHIDPIMVDLVDKLVRDNLSVYPTDKSFTLWNMASKLALNGNPLKCLDDNEFDCIEDMFEAGKRNLQKINEKNQTTLNPPVIDFSQLSSQNTAVSNTPHTPEEDKPKIRYWNEFDDGDEAMDQDFYSFSGEENDEFTHDTGLIKFNPSFVIAIYHVLSKFQTAFGITDEIQARKSLLRDTTNSYNSIGTDNSMLTSSSERNDVHKFWELEEQNSESIYEFEHDQVISFFYVSSLLISCLTTGVTIGIMTSLFNSLNDDTQLENETPILTMIFISLSVSLVLGAWSLLLLFSRFTFAPTWHYITSVVIFIIIIFAVCYGFIELIL